MVENSPSSEAVTAAAQAGDEHFLVDDHPTGQRCTCEWFGTGGPGDTFEEHKYSEILKAAHAADPAPDLADDNLDLAVFDLGTRDALVAATLRFMVGRGYTVSMGAVTPDTGTSTRSGLDRLGAAVHFLDYVAGIANLGPERAHARYSGLVVNAAGIKDFVMGAPNVNAPVTDVDRDVVRGALAGRVQTTPPQDGPQR